MCILHIGVHEVHEIWQSLKTSPAAQRTETFVKQGFKNMLVKVFLQKPNYFPTQMTIKFTHYNFSPKNTLIYLKNPTHVINKL